MATVKKALFSPAVNEQQQIPSAADEQQLFEDKFGEMAYQAFSSKFPDLVAEIVTFKMLDSDLDTGTAVGAFIIEQEGDFVYVPVVLSANELKPFDLVYIKSKDIFLPLTNEWLEEVKKGTISSLGEGSKLPDTVPTDVDIRNIVVPPTTGRYSYASYNKVTPSNRLEAQASEPLGRKLTKLANIGPFPGGNQPGMQQSDFNPQLWATFVEQFQRTQKMTPGQALDSGSLDVETMSKMYKSHTKTWEMMADPGANPLANSQSPGLAADGSDAQMQGQAPAAPQQPMQTMASYKAASSVPRTIGQKLETIIDNAIRSGGIGAVTGGLTEASHENGGTFGDVLGASMRGALGGAVLGGPLGSLTGEEVAAQVGSRVNPERAKQLGRLGGSILGGYVGANSEPMHFDPSALQGGYRYASDHNADIARMLKHAMQPGNYKPQLPAFLSSVSPNVKKAYIQVLKDNPALLKKTAELYGENVLVNALRVKTAGVSTTGGKLLIADKNTKTKTYLDFFGEEAPAAFRGVALRGYYFKDTRPSLNLAVQVQEYHDAQDAMNSGVYRIYSVKGTPKTALVLVEPFDLTSDARITFPKDDSRVKRLKTKVPVNTAIREPNSQSGYPDNDVARSHEYTRVAIFDDGTYLVTENLFGEETSESALKGSSIYNALMTNAKASPTKGSGIFVVKHGTSYKGSLPVEIREMSTGTNGVIRGKLSSDGGWGTKNFVIDPRSPINRPMKIKDEDLVIIPASWKWVKTKSRADDADFLRSASGISDIVLNALGSMGVTKAVVRDAGQSMYDVDGARTINKVAALQLLATQHNVHASAAEAMLKIASVEGVCRSYIVAPSDYQSVKRRIKTAQGMEVPQTQMGAPPAMQQAPMEAPPPAPGAAEQMGPPGLPPAMQAPAEAPPSPVDLAFSEAMDSLQEQMTALQAQLDVLTTVQQRAQEIAGGGAPQEAAPPADPAMQQGMAPPADPAMQQGMAQPADPAMQQGMPQDMQGMPAGMSPEMGVDPNAAPAEAPAFPIMRTEEPSAQEIASQINPAFLNSAASLHETGAFDAGTIASLARSSNMKSVTSQYAASLEESVDDLGRTLLTLYMQEPKLKEQLGDATFVDLETQLRDTFQGLGKLVLSLTHNASMLDPNALS